MTDDRAVDQFIAAISDPLYKAGFKDGYNRGLLSTPDDQDNTAYWRKRADKAEAELEGLTGIIAGVRNGNGHTVLIDGVLIAKCDTYGKTDEHRRAERAEAEVAELREEVEELRVIANVNGDWNVKYEQSQRWRREAEAEVEQLRGRLDHASELVTFWCDSDAEARGERDLLRAQVAAVQKLAEGLVRGKDPEIDPRIFDPWDVSEMIRAALDTAGGEQ